jgi:hypothetical protein
MLLFQWRVVSNGQSDKRRLCEKRLIVFTAADGRAALREAKRRGRRAQFNYKNGRVYFEFVGLLDLLHLGLECEADEMWYQICRLQQPMERRGQLLPQEEYLQAVAQDRTSRLSASAPVRK